jgi:hypothetical protein
LNGAAMRVCYLIQSHREPRQIARLAATLRRQSPGCLVVVAHDESSCRLSPDLFGGDPGIRYLGIPGPIRRGYLSMLDPYFRAVAWLREQREPYDWLAYLSGQDYPLRPLRETEAVLAGADCDGFMSWWPALDDTPWGRRWQGHRRYYYRYRDLAPPWSRLLRLARRLNGWQSRYHVHLAYGPRLGRRADRTPFENGRVCYAGRQWTTLRRRCAEFVVDQAARDPELMTHFADTICPDEAVVQTLLLNAGQFRFMNDNLRYANTEGRRDGSALVLGEADLPALLACGYHFARKFDLERGARALDLLDERLG